jgi:general secretion pathway protein N
MAGGAWTRRRVTPAAAASLALAALCGVLLWLVGAELKAPSAELPLPADRAAPPTGNALPAEPGFVPRSFDAYAQVTQRPVFSPTRRPPAETAPPVLQPGELVLAGIVGTEAERTALVLYGQPLKPVRLKEGQTVGGWTVRSILPDRILVEAAGTTRELRLRETSAQGLATR